MRVGAFEVADPAPELRDTVVLAMLEPWVNVGKVGKLVLNKIEQHLGARELGRLARPGTFFDFTRDRPQMKLVEGRRVLSIPNVVAKFARDDETDRDFIFLHLREPHTMGEDYADAIVGLLQHFDVGQYCRVGGMYDSVPHTRPLKVTGTFNEAKARLAAGLVSPRGNTYQGPTSIVNLVTDVLEAAGTETCSLMVHVPQYAQLDEDHLAAGRLLEVLCAIYDLPSSLADLERGKQQYQYISKLVQNNAHVTGIIEQLEAEYDRPGSGEGGELSDQPIELAPDVETFLQQMGKRLENGNDEV